MVSILSHTMQNTQNIVILSVVSVFVVVVIVSFNFVVVVVCCGLVVLFVGSYWLLFPIYSIYLFILYTPVTYKSYKYVLHREPLHIAVRLDPSIVVIQMMCHTFCRSWCKCGQFPWDYALNHDCCFRIRPRKVSVLTALLVYGFGMGMC